jgi:hypothetical protein
VKGTEVKLMEKGAEKRYSLFDRNGASRAKLALLLTNSVSSVCTGIRPATQEPVLSSYLCLK